MVRVHLNDEIVYHTNGTATVSKDSMFSGTRHTFTMTFTEKQYDAWRDGGLLVQDAMPQLKAWEREFLMTGVTNKEWDEQFMGDDGDEEDSD